MTDESTTGEKLGTDAAKVLAMARGLVDAGLADVWDALDAIQTVVQAYESQEDALVLIDEVRAFLDRPVVPEYPGGTTTKEGQPRAVPKFESTPDPSEPAGALATPPPPGSPGGPPTKVRPTPRIKDPNQKTRPRLPDGLGQLGATEGER